ncbi:thaumatin-like protein [Mycena sanguinolenta]|nr:thaumatin-like protein [Mycena sanguinolenta]
MAMASTAAAQRTMAVHNVCSFLLQTSWTTVDDHLHHLRMPLHHLRTGHIWGRRDCDFSTNPGPNSCLDVPLAEFNFNGGGNDWYDVSLVDGFNLPMRIDNNVGCEAPSCPVDLGTNCPAALHGPFNSAGFAVGCKSACYVDAVNDNAANSPNCCSGQYDTAATCPPSGVTDYSYFKDNSYAYALELPVLFECGLYHHFLPLKARNRRLQHNNNRHPVCGWPVTRSILQII